MAALPTIVIPGDDPPQMQGSDQLERLGLYGRVVLHTDKPLDLADQISRVQQATVIINSRNSMIWPGELLRDLRQLRMIAVCGIGADKIDLEAARSLGIIVSNVPGKTAPIVAEHALGLMLSAAKRMAFQTSALRSGVWTKMHNVFLRGKTLGVVGTGATGTCMIQLGLAIGMKVVAWTFHPSPDRAASLGVPYVELDELLESSDVVSLHLKLTAESRNFIGEDRISRMKRGCILVNVARGGLVETDALVGALKSNHLGGAGLDVFDIEPLPPGHALLGCEQVILTPHTADATSEGIELLNRGVADNVISFLEGKPQNVL